MVSVDFMRDKSHCASVINIINGQGQETTSPLLFLNRLHDTHSFWQELNILHSKPVSPENAFSQTTSSSLNKFS